jgi:hypothetical protein
MMPRTTSIRWPLPIEGHGPLGMFLNMSNPWLVAGAGADLLGIGSLLGREYEHRKRFIEKLSRDLVLSHIDVVSADLGREANGDAVWVLGLRFLGTVHSLQAKFPASAEPFGERTLLDLAQRVRVYFSRA